MPQRIDLHKLEGVDVSFLSYYNTDPKQTHHLIEVLCQQENAKKVRKHSVSFTESPWKPAVLWRKIYMFQVPEKNQLRSRMASRLVESSIFGGGIRLKLPFWTKLVDAQVSQSLPTGPGGASILIPKRNIMPREKRWKADRSEPSSLGLGILRLRISLMEWNFNF